MRPLNLLLLFAALARAVEFPPRVVPPDLRPAFGLEISGRMDRKSVPECSALVASRRDPKVFWTLSDSGSPARIVPIRAGGQPVLSSGGVDVTGASNLDWEALVADDAGNLVIADVGNNLSRRRELHLYVIPEPAPGSTATMPARLHRFAWPDQTQFPDPDQRHDCEAAFAYRGKVHLLTKHRRDTLTELWRADLSSTSDRAYLTQVAALDARGMVTDASVSPDGKWLAVLTYRVLWVFDLSGQPENPLSGPAHCRALAPPAAHWQLEGCAWIDDATLLLGSEEGALFRVPLAEIVR